jgi:hypothetical protein
VIRFLRDFFWYVVPHRCVVGEVFVFPARNNRGQAARMAWCGRCNRLMPAQHDSPAEEIAWLVDPPAPREASK